MSLQGSFETIALRDVMALLASSNKSGELRVVGGQIEGRLWMHDGCLVGSKVGKSHGHVDALFELLRLREGNFVFKDGVDAPSPEEATPVEPAMREAEERLKEWEDIQLVVPSLEHRVRLIPDLATPEVTLSAHEWHLVMAVALAATVRGVLDELDLGQFEGCRGIRRLVDAGLVIVEPPRVRPSVSDPARLARRSAAGAPDAGARSPRQVHRPAPPSVLAGQPSALETAVAEANVAMTLDSLGALSALSSAPAPTPSPSPFPSGSAMAVPTSSDLDSLRLSPRVFSPPEDQFPVEYDDDDHDLATVSHFPLSQEHDVAVPAANGATPDQSALDALRGRRARLRALAQPDANPVVVPYAQEDVTSAPSVVAVALNGTEGAPGPAAEPAERDHGGDSINRGLLLKFLSSVRS